MSSFTPALLEPTGATRAGRAVFRVAEPLGALAQSAVLHDFLHERLAFSKVEGDAIFLTAVAAEGLFTARRELVFLAGRLNPSRARPR